MRVVALTFGTEGDMRPMVALCRGLRDADVDAVLLGDRSAADCAAQYDVPFVPLAGDMADALRQAAGGFLEKGARLASMAKALAEIARANTAAWMRATLEYAVGVDGIVCGGLAIYVGLSCAEHLRIPVVGAGLQPMMPTREFPSPFIPPWRMPGLANTISHRLVLAMMWRAFRGAINDARRDVARQPPRHAQFGGYPVVCGVSPSLVAQPRDWPEAFAITGDWSLPADSPWVPPPALADFLAEGEPPAYVGFGSIVGFDRARFRDVVLDALAGRRALLFSGWSGFGDGALPSNVLSIGPTPHGWLFPRTSVVVHHGGAGTTHAAARAGVPSVVVPFAGDQPFWADRLRRAGVAPPAIPQAQLTSVRFREALTAARDQQIVSRARAVGARIAQEDGIAIAVARITRAINEARV